MDSLYRAVNAVHRLGHSFVRLPDASGVPVYAAADRATRDAFGDVIAYAYAGQIYVRSRRAWTRKVRAHELTHIRQQRRHGLLFPLLYWTETARKGYWNNRFEVAARRAETRAARPRRAVARSAA